MKKKQNETEQETAKEEANVNITANVRNKSFYFDTVCTSNKAFSTGSLLIWKKLSGCVKSKSQVSMLIVGKRDVNMEWVFRQGLVAAFPFLDVLHVPMLSHALNCWRKSLTKGYTEFGEGDYTSNNKVP